MDARIAGGTTNIQIKKEETRGAAGGGDSEADGSTEDAVRVREKRMKASPSRPPSHGAPIVLVVDDGETNRALVHAYLADLDCRLRSAEDGPSALASIEAEPPDLVLLDVQMPGMDGYEVCRRIKARPRGRLLPVVMLTALDHANDRVLALESGADDFMTKPVDRVELVARVRSALRLKAVYDNLDSAEQVIFSLAAAVEAKDAYTEKHTHRVAESARHVGMKMGLPERALEALYRGGIIHDIGKIGVPDAILLKPGPLNADELARMRMHPAIGEAIVKPLRSGATLLPIIRHHHENFDGSGYPDGLAGRAIPHLARIVAVCDAYDALVTDRPYRGAKSPQQAVAVLMEGAGKQWDAEAVEVLVSEMANITALGIT
jgi:putative two-component system response regulator